MNSMHINVILKKDKQEYIILYYIIYIIVCHVYLFILFYMVCKIIYIYNVYLTFISKTIYTYNNDYDT